MAASTNRLLLRLIIEPYSTFHSISDHTYSAVINITDVFACINLTERVCDRARHDCILRTDQSDGKDHECRVKERMEIDRARYEQNQYRSRTAQWHADELRDGQLKREREKEN